jgi:integrase
MAVLAASDPLLDISPAPADERRDPTSLRARDQLIYLAQSVNGGPIKIGCSRDPEARIAALQTSHPERLRLLLVYAGGAHDERELHARFAEHRLEGEWFRPAASILAFIESMVIARQRGRGRKRKLPKTLTRDEVQRLFAMPNLAAPTGLRDRCMMELMYRAGLRVGEVCNLRPRDVDIDAGTIRIWDGKGGDGTAYFDPEPIRVLLEQWKATRRKLPKSDYFFCTLKGGRISSRAVEQMFKRRSGKAAIESRCTPHVLRHTFATELLDEGFTIREVQEALRHADVSTTMIYTHVLDSNLRAKIHRRQRG